MGPVTRRPPGQPDDGEFARADALAGLAREVDGLRRGLDPLARCPDPGRRPGPHRGPARRRPRRRPTPPGPDPGAVVAGRLRRPATRRGRCSRSCAAGCTGCSCATPTPPRCCPSAGSWHPDVVEELLWLQHAWLGAYEAKGASVQLAGDWHDRQRPGVVRRLKAAVGSCSKERHQTRARLGRGAPRRGAESPGSTRSRIDRRLVGRPPRRPRPRTRPRLRRDRSPRLRRRASTARAARRRVGTGDPARRASMGGGAAGRAGGDLAARAGGRARGGGRDRARALRGRGRLPGPGRDRLALPADHRRARAGRLRRHRPPRRPRRPLRLDRRRDRRRALRDSPRPPTWPAARPSRSPRRCGSGSGPGPRSPPRSSRTCSTCSPPSPTVQPAGVQPRSVHPGAVQRGQSVSLNPTPTPFSPHRADDPAPGARARPARRPGRRRRRSATAPKRPRRATPSATAPGPRSPSSKRPPRSPAAPPPPRSKRCASSALPLRLITGHRPRRRHRTRERDPAHDHQPRTRPPNRPPRPSSPTHHEQHARTTDRAKIKNDTRHRSLRRTDDQTRPTRHHNEEIKGKIKGLTPMHHDPEVRAGLRPAGADAHDASSDVRCCADVDLA